MLSWLHSEVTNVVSVVSAVFHTPSFAEHFISKLKKYGNTVVDIEDGFFTFEIKENSLGFVDTTGQVHILKAPWEEELAKYLESIRSKIVYIDHGDLSEVWEESDFRAYKNELVAQGLIELEPRITFHDLEINQTITFDSEVELELYLKWVTRYGRPDEEIEASPTASKLLTGSLAVSGAFVGAGMLKGLEHLATKVSFGQGFVAANSLVLSCAHVVTGYNNLGLLGLAALVSFAEQAPVAAALDTYGWNTTFAEVLSSKAYGNAETGYLAGTASTGYALAGGSSLDAKIMLLDSEFGLTWGRMFNESVSFDITGIARTTDQGLVVVGGTTLGAGAGDGIVLKVSAAGDQVFANTIGDTDENTLTAVAATTDGGFIMAGNTLKYGNTWAATTTLAALPEERAGSAVVGYNGKIYVFGGYSTDGAELATFVYDIAAGSWSTQSSLMPLSGGYAPGVVYDGKIYVTGGRDNAANALDALREYNPSTEQWVLKAPMQYARATHSVAVVNNKFYVFGGTDTGQSALDSVEEYDPITDRWIPKASLLSPRDLAPAAVVNGKIYVIGGYTGSAFLDLVAEYDPLTNTWDNNKQVMPTARCYHNTVVLGDKIYVFGGQGSSGHVATVEVYDPLTDSWSVHADLTVGKELYPSATLVDGKIYTVGGWVGAGILSDVESYTPAATKKATLTKMSAAGALAWSKVYTGIQTSLDAVVTLSDGYLGLGSAELADGATHLLLLKTDTLGTITLARTYGVTSGYQVGSQVVVTTTGYVMAGYSENNGYSLIVKVATSGTIIWSKRVGTTGEHIITHIQKTADDGVLVAATIDGEDTVVFKLASDGVLSWSRLWSATDSIEKVTSITQDASGNYILLGATDQLSWPKLDTVLMRLSPSGEFLDDCTLFTATWSDIADLTVTSASITLTTSDFTPTLATASEVGLQELDVTSSSLCTIASSDAGDAWTSHDYFANRYTTTSYGNVAASALVPLTSGYAVAGGNELDTKLMMLDTDFYPVWSRVFASRLDLVFGGLVQMSDGSLALAGSMTNGGLGSYDAVVMKVDTTGSKLWSKVIGNAYENTARALVATSDGGIAIAGGISEYLNTWSPLASLPEARATHAVVNFEGSIYVFGGNSSVLSSTVVYDIAANSWTTKSSSMPEPALYLVGAELDSKIYVLGGLITTFATSTREYNPSTDQWALKQPMLNRREYPGVAVVDGKIYVFGGYDRTDVIFLNSVEMYDPTSDTWTTKTSMLNGRNALTATVVDGKVYCIGGQIPFITRTNVVEEYNPISDTWTTKTPMATARAYHGASLYNGKIYVYGGMDEAGVALDSVEVYDPAANTWSAYTSIGIARRVSSTIVDDTIYIIGGLDSIGTYYSDVYSYNLAAAEKGQITKLTAQGAHAWSRSYMSAGMVFNAIIQTTDDGYVALGSIATSPQAMVLQKTTATGVHSWARTYSGSWVQEGQGIIATSTGYMLWGSSYESDTSYVGLIAKLDTTGNVLWSKQIGLGIATSKLITGIHETSDNGFLVIASTGDAAVLFKLDSAGVLQWSRMWSTSAEARLAALATELNGDILVLGTTDQFTSPKVETILMRLDSTGSMDGSCVLATSTWSDIADYTLTVASITPTVTSFTPTVADAGIDVRDISLEVASTCYRPSVATSLASQTDCCDASIGNAYSFTFDEATFDVSITTSYSATLADGSDLPSWLTFTAGVRSFTGTPTGAVTNLAIKVTATDSNGGTAIDTFTLSIVGSLTVTNGSGAISYTEDTAYNMPDIEVSTPSTTVTATLTLSDIAAGSLNTATSGVVTSSYNAATGVWEASGARADVNSLLAGLVFTPAADKSGAFSITVYVTDGYSQTASSTITATGVAVNDIPVITQVTKSGTEDTTVTFTASDFTSHYADTEGSALASIQITSLPTHGSLLLDSIAVTLNQVIVAADLSKLTFVPEAEWHGATSFGWRASDATDYSVATTVSLTVSAVNDVPVITEVTKTGTEDAPVTFTASDFTSHYTDIDSDALASIQITSLPAHGSLLLDGTDVTLNQVIVVADLGSLTFVPEAEWHGATSFGWQASDGTVYSAANTVSLTLSAVNDVPVITEVTKTGTEDVTVTFTLSDFTSHYTDIDGDALASIQITSLPLHGSLLLDGTDVTLNQVIVAADLSKLTLVPEGDWNGVTSFNWRASDGTAYSTANTLSLSISAVNDRPVLVNNAMYVTQGQTVILTEDMLSATDVDTIASTLIFKLSDITHGRFEIISDPGTGILSFTQQQVASRQVRFVHDASAAAPSYKVVVSDGALETTAVPATVTFAPSQATSTSGNTGDGSSLAPIIAGVVGGVVAVGAAVFGVMGYRKWKAHKELAANQKVWNFDWHLRPPVSRVHGYRLITAKAVDIQKVVAYYQRCPVPGMDVKSVKIIFTPDQEQGFAARIKLLQEREGRAAFEPKWSQEANVGLRTEVMARLSQMVTPYHDEEYGAVKFVPMWHGTRPEILDSIFKTGYADLSTTDEGFFGKGLYSAYEARYAYKVYSKGALLVNWVTFFSAYPVVDGDMPRLVGKGNYGNYDAHFVPVRPRTTDPDEVNFYPCVGMHEAVYHEMVVFQAEQCLPRYLVELQPSLPQSPAVMVAISPSMTPQSGASPEQEQPLAGTSQSVATNPHAFFMPALSPVASDRQLFRGVPVAEAPIAPAELSQSRGHHHGKHHHSHKGRSVEMTQLPTEQPSPRV